MDAKEVFVAVGLLLGGAVAGIAGGRRSKRADAEAPPQQPQPQIAQPAPPPPPATQSGQWGALPDHAAVLAPLDQLIERIADRVVKPIEGKIDNLAEDIAELKQDSARRHQDHEQRIRAAEIAIARVGLVKRKDTPT